MNKNVVNNLGQAERKAYEPREIWEKQILPLSRSGVYVLLKQKKLRHIRLNRKILIPVDAIDEFLQNKKGEV